MTKHFATFCLLWMLVESVNARPADMPAPIWCLNDVQLSEMGKRMEATISKSSPDDLVSFPLRAGRKMTYLFIERLVDRHNDVVERCNKYNEVTGNMQTCPTPGLGNLEKDMKGLAELEKQPMSDKDQVKMTSVFERLNAIRAEYPSCK